MIHNKKYKLIITFILSAFLMFFGTAAKKVSKKELKAKGVINSFETLPSETVIGDFDLETNGYVQLEQFKKNKTNGKYSAQAIFSVPGDFLPEKEAKKAKTWISAVTTSINTLTKLKITDWSQYKKFNVDVFSANEKTIDFFIKITDSSGKEYIALRPVKAGKNKLEVDLADIKTKRIDLSNITSFSLYLDTKDEVEDITLYLDYIRITP